MYSLNSKQNPSNSIIIYLVLTDYSAHSVFKIAIEKDDFSTYTIIKYFLLALLSLLLIFSNFDSLLLTKKLIDENQDVSENWKLYKD